MKNKAEKKNFKINFIKLFSATLFAQLLTIIISPILTRIYTPEDFAVFAIYMSIISLLIVFITGRYEIAISTAKDLSTAIILFKLVVYYSIITTLIVTLITIFINQYIIKIDIYNSTYFWLIPLSLILFGIFQALTYLLNRFQKFNYIASGKVIQSFSNNFFTLILGFLSFNSLGMVFANIISMTVVITSNLIRSKLLQEIINTRAKLVDYFKLMKSHKNYPIYNSMSGFLDALAIQAPILILTKFFSETVVGLYSFTIRIMTLPVSLISSAISQLFLSQLVTLNNNNQSLTSTVTKALMILTLIGILPFSTIYLFAEDLFSLIFGNEWAMAGSYASILSISYFAKFVVSPLSVIFYVKERIKLLSLIQACRAIMSVTILFICGLSKQNILNTLIAFSVFEVLFYLVYLFFIIKLAKD